MNRVPFILFFCFVAPLVGLAKEAYDTARVVPVTGHLNGSQKTATIELKSTGMRPGAINWYDVVALNSNFSQPVKMFPGDNTVSIATADGTDMRTVHLSVTKPSLRVQLSWAGNNQDYDLHVNDIYYGNRQSNGGTLDHDWIRNSSEGNPVENVTYPNANAGLYRIYVHYYSDNQPGGGSPLSTTIRIYVNESLVLTKSYKITDDSGGSSSGDGRSLWNVGTIVLHSDTEAGGYAVDGVNLDTPNQGEKVGVSPRTSFDIDTLKGPNDSNPVVLSLGQSAQFVAKGTVNSGSSNEQTKQFIIEKFTSSDEIVGTVDALGVFVAEAVGHTQISCAGYEGTPIDVYVVDATIAPDYNRDGVVDAGDVENAQKKKPFRFWKNDDDDSGDISGGTSDIPAQGGLINPDYANSEDSYVNGRSDLLDFSPVWLNLHDALSTIPQSAGLSYKLSQANGAVNVVWTPLRQTTANTFLTENVDGCGTSLNKQAREAQTVHVSSSGTEIPTAFLDLIRQDASKGIILIEGYRQTTAPLVLGIYKGSKRIWKAEMPLNISPVEEMYRWVNLRSIVGGSQSRDSNVSEPANFPDAESNGKQFVFVHGYNVSEDKARGWNAEMFKRLWQTGANSMYTAVTWYGDDSRVPWIDATPNYYVNVEHAFATASSLATTVGALPGTSKIIAAHSLGNMLVSSAAIDWQMEYSKYFMFNAAVAREAYSAVTVDTLMTHPEWTMYPNKLWASNWHQLFPEGDGRRTLCWKGRFAGLENAVNFYSSTEDVLAASDGTVPSVGGYRSWVCQEMNKGSTLMVYAPGRSEGGWGFNGEYTGFFGGHMNPTNAAELADATLRVEPFFRQFDNSEIVGTNGSFVASQPAMRRQLLADAIPALSNPAGSSIVPSLTNLSLMSFKKGTYTASSWPRENDGWVHSDIKNIAYFFNSTLFVCLKIEGDL